MTEEGKHGLFDTLYMAWRAYGGMKAVWESPFFWLSVFLLAVTAHFWLTQPWWEQVLSVMPNVLGFTLGGFAIFLGFGDTQFRELISGQDEGVETPSPYAEVSATFLHFVLVQLCSILMAISVKATNFVPPEWLQRASDVLISVKFIADGLGYWLFLYGLCITAAAAIAIFRVSSWYDDLQSINRLNDDNKENK